MLTRSHWILAGAWLVLCVAVIFTGMALRLSPIEQAMLWPGFLKSMLVPLAVLFSAGAALLLWVGSGHARGLMVHRPWAEMILFFPLIFAFIWLVLPVRGMRMVDSVILAALAAAAVWLLYQSRVVRPAEGPSLQRFLPIDLLMILAPVALGLVLGLNPDSLNSGWSILVYPGFALTQLAVFLVIPAARLARFGLKPWQTSLMCAAVFGLVHAPNPTIVVLSSVGMYIWCRQYLAGRKLWQLAVVMGLSATTLTQFVPDQFTDHMRVGPGFLQSRAVTALAGNDFTEEQREPRAFVALIYPKTVGRQATVQELDTWQDLIGRSQRAAMAWQFFTSDEYARRAAAEGWPAPPRKEVHWTQYEVEWRDRINSFGSNVYWAKCGGELTGFAKCLYRDILQRGGSSAEVLAWSDEFSQDQRRSLVQVLLNNGTRWRTSSFTGMSVIELAQGY